MQKKNLWFRCCWSIIFGSSEEPTETNVWVQFREIPSFKLLHWKGFYSANFPGVTEKLDHLQSAPLLLANLASSYKLLTTLNNGFRKQFQFVGILKTMVLRARFWVLTTISILLSMLPRKQNELWCRQAEHNEQNLKIYNTNSARK